MIAATMSALASQVRAMTARERAGLAIAAALAAIAAAFYAADWANARANVAHAAAQEAVDAEAAQAAWSDPAYQASVAARASDVRRWSASADPLSGEEVLSELENLALQAGFMDTEVTPVRGEDSRDLVRATEVSLAATFDWASFLSLLEGFENAELSLKVRSVDVTQEGETQRLTLLVSAPLVNEAPAR